VPKIDKNKRLRSKPYNMPPKDYSKDIEEMKKLEEDLLSLGLPRYRIHQQIGEKVGLSRTRVRVLLSGQTLLK
jgi:hypothetical protein